MKDFIVIKKPNQKPEVQCIDGKTISEVIKENIDTTFAMLELELMGNQIDLVCSDEYTENDEFNFCYDDDTDIRGVALFVGLNQKTFDSIPLTKEVAELVAKVIAMANNGNQNE
jgi:hypothetical protein